MTPENDFNTAAAPTPAPEELVDALDRLNSGHVKHLLKRGADAVAADRMMRRGVPEARRSRGFTAMGWAAYHDRKDIALWLFRAGVDINGQDQEGCTPLMLAVTYHQYKAVRFFVSRGASLEIKNHEGKTVHDLAGERNDLIKGVFYEAVEARQRVVQEETAERITALHSTVAGRQKDLNMRARSVKVAIKRIL